MVRIPVAKMQKLNVKRTPRENCDFVSATETFMYLLPAKTIPIFNALEYI